MSRSIDDIAITKSGYKFRSSKIAPELYSQKMQSRQGKRKFELVTRQFTDYVLIVLYELREGKNSYRVGLKRVLRDEHLIKDAVKALERKAKCKLYYVLLISTDGEYL